MYEKKFPQPTGPSRSRFVASSSNSGSRCGGGNGVDNACAPCCRSCADSVYGTCYHAVDRRRFVYPLPSLFSPPIRVVVAILP